MKAGPDGSLYTTGRTPRGDYAVQKVSPDGSVTTLARIYGGYSIAIGPQGYVYVIGNVKPHQRKQNLYRISPRGKVRLIANIDMEEIVTGPGGDLYGTGMKTIYQISPVH